MDIHLLCIYLGTKYIVWLASLQCIVCCVYSSYIQYILCCIRMLQHKLYLCGLLFYSTHPWMSTKKKSTEICFVCCIVKSCLKETICRLIVETHLKCYL